MEHNKNAIGTVLGKAIVKGKSAIACEDDYLDIDGFIHCAKCRGRKQKDVTMLGNTHRVYCLCECQVKAKEDAERTAKEKAHREMVKELNKGCYHYPRNLAYTFDKSDHSFPSQEAVCKAFCDHWKENLYNGKGLTLCGNVGNGKTFLASAICNELMQRGVSCKFTDIPSIAFAVQKTFEKQSVYDELDNYDLLVIDDLFAERDTEYMNEVVETTINNRYQTKKPIIVTSNLTEFEMDSARTMPSRRAVSRLHEMTDFLEFGGKDKRKTK